MKVSGQYLHSRQVIREMKINLLRARRESRAEREREREDKDYNTHLAEISYAGQGLCNIKNIQTQ